MVLKNFEIDKKIKLFKLKELLTVLLFFLVFCINSYSKEESRIFRIEGKIINIENTYLSFETDDGKVLRLRLAPKWFLKENNFNISLTDKIKIEFFEIDNGNSVMQISKVEIKGKKYMFVDSNFNILWKRKGFYNKNRDLEEEQSDKENKKDKTD